MKELKFIKIPKTGSTFFEKNFHSKYANIDGEEYFINSVGHSWLYPTQIKGWRDWDFPEQIPNIFRDVMEFSLNPTDKIVTLIRNPFEILFSYFNYDWGSCRTHYGFDLQSYTIDDFQKFVDIYLDKSIVFHAPSLRNSLFSQLKDINGNWILNDDSIVLRFENLNKDINNFCSISGLDIIDSSDTAQNSAKNSKPCKWYEAYRDDQIDKLNQLWKDDLEYFGYSFYKEDEEPIVVEPIFKNKTNMNISKNPKIAICFSGHIRDLERTKEYWSHIIKENDMDVYASFWDEENYEIGDTLENFHRLYNVKKVEIESFKSFESSTLSLVREYISPPTDIQEYLRESAKRFDSLPMWYKIWKANMLSKSFDIDYDIIVRARTDSHFNGYVDIVDNGYLNIPFGMNRTHQWENSEGMNDIFAFGNPKIMDYYSLTFLYMMEHLNKGHYMIPAEHFLHTHMNKVSIPIKFIDEYITITRTAKGGSDEIYNQSFLKTNEIIKSDFMDLNPNPNVNWTIPIKKLFE